MTIEINNLSTLRAHMFTCIDGIRSTIHRTFLQSNLKDAYRELSCATISCEYLRGLLAALLEQDKADPTPAIQSFVGNVAPLLGQLQVSLKGVCASLGGGYQSTLAYADANEDVARIEKYLEKEIENDN